MKKLLFFLVSLILSTAFFGQVVINELDCDTSSIDTHEFIELKSVTANYSLNGLVLVFFNGSASGADSSYYTIDLNGYTTDLNGLLLIGSSNVSPFPQLIIPENTIQNGADAIGLYLGDDTDFPDGTLATTTNLIDALAYDTSDPDDAVLMGLLGLSKQINENKNNKKDTESIQRKNDGNYEVKSPTPKALNDGNGNIFNGVTIGVDQHQYDEGDNFDITFTTDQNVNVDLNINFSLSNKGFSNNDYTGATNVTIVKGQNSISTTISITDDKENEGDEVLIINMGTLPNGYQAMNNLISIRIVDNDYVVAAWGTPLNPTYGIVTSTQPSNYYDILEGLSAAALAQALQDILADSSVVRTQTYTDCIEILKEADQNPENSNEVWLVYTEQGRPKLDFQTTSNSTGKWNREHTFPRSLGGFNSIDDDDIPDGKNTFWQTNADSLRHANSDAHALRAVDGPENSVRKNRYYGNYSGPTGNSGSFKGDVARSVLYIHLRYNGLSVVNSPTVTGQMGYLATLLDWHKNDPPDDFEMNRNNLVYTWQFNRNPLIDLPELVAYIWGTKIGQIWNKSLHVEANYITNSTVFPNPMSNKLFIKESLNQTTKLTIYSMNGKVVFSTLLHDKSIDINLKSGLYFLKLEYGTKQSIQKLIVN